MTTNYFVVASTLTGRRVIFFDGTDRHASLGAITAAREAQREIKGEPVWCKRDWTPQIASWEPVDDLDAFGKPIVVIGESVGGGAEVN